jgi:23S rRNA pseudouridine2605 synthase
MIRLNRFIAVSLGISRRQADKLITAGSVTFNDSIATLGATVKDSDYVKVDGKILEPKSSYTYLLLNKPTDYVCSRRGQGSLTIYELLPKEYWRLKPAGRLDKDSSGLLLLTDDGQLIYDLTHPSSQKTKIYEAELDKPLNSTDFKIIISGGVTLNDGLSQFRIEPQGNTLKITMHEGRNRQIRRTFKALGYKVVKLHRTQIGDYKLSDLAIGKYKLL